MDVQWLPEERRRARRRDGTGGAMGFPFEDVAYGLIVATYRRRMRVIAVPAPAPLTFLYKAYPPLSTIPYSMLQSVR